MDVKLVNPENRYTVFAPPDKAFANLPEGTLDYLKSKEVEEYVLHKKRPQMIEAKKS